MRLAEKTLLKIEEVMSADQGNSYRYWLGKVIPHMSDAYRQENEGYRTHLGASVIGGECGRELWYGFRWSSTAHFPARILRLFNRGHLEEARFIAILLSIGVKVYQHDQEGKQFRISEFGGHFGGSGDGVLIGIPDLPFEQPVLGEFKTHNDKSFKDLSKKGVRLSKPEHFTQMQIYMKKMNLHYALYGAVNKNDDSLHLEIIEVDPLLGSTYIDRAHTIIFHNELPKRISNTPGWYKCSWCNYKEICHMGADPDKNCRSCAHSSPQDDGSWLCREHGHTLDKQDQIKGCDDWSKHSGYYKE